MEIKVILFIKKFLSFSFAILLFLLITFFFTKQANAYCYESCDSQALCNQPSIYYCPNPSNPSIEDCSQANRPNCYWTGWVWHTGACCGSSSVCSVDQLSCVPYFSTCRGVNCNNLGIPPCVEEPSCDLYNCIPTGNLLNPGMCQLAPLPTPTVIPTNTPTPAPSPSISVSPQSGPAGSTFDLSGQNFPALSPFLLRVWDQSPSVIYTQGFTTDSRGAINTTFSMPSGQIGSFNLRVSEGMAGTGNMVAEAPFSTYSTITPGVPTTTPTPIPCCQRCTTNSPTSVCATGAISCDWAYSPFQNEGLSWCYCSSCIISPTPTNIPTSAPPSPTSSPQLPTNPPFVTPPGWWQIHAPPNSVPENITPDKIVQFLFNLFVALGIILALIFLLYGAIKWIVSRGDKAALESARSHIVMAIVGLLLVILSWVIVNLILKILGLPDLPGQITIPKFNQL